MKTIILLLFFIFFNSNRALADELKMQGSFNPLQIGGTVNEIMFELYEKKETFDFYVKIFAKKSKESYCVYEVRKITSPQRTRGLMGVLVVYPHKCKLQSHNERINTFWSRIDRFAIYYRFNNKGKLFGHIQFPGVLERLKLLKITLK